MRGLVVAINKWDELDNDKREHIVEIKRLRFAEFADVLISGTGVGHLYKSINEAYRAATDVSTTRLTKILEVRLNRQHHGAQSPYQTALCPCRRKKPPVIIIHGNQTDSVPAQYTDT